MAKLTAEVQTAIVCALACFCTPAQVIERMKAEHGLTLDRRQVQLYDPLRKGVKPAKKWCALFEQARQTFLDDRANVAISHKVWRLQQLEAMCRAAMTNKNYALAAQLLEQAAKEEGNVFQRRVSADEDEDASNDAETRAAQIRAALGEMEAATLGRPALAVVQRTSAA